MERIKENLSAVEYAYIDNRRKGMPALRAMAAARAKPSAWGGYPSFLVGGNVTRRPSRPQYAWIENPEMAGLRFVKYADEIAPRSIQHTGWYTSEHGDNGENYRGAVYRLPHSRGLIAGYEDPNNAPACFVELSLWDSDDGNGAAFAADRIAELEAESAREYNEAWQAGRRFEDLGEQISSARRSCLELIREAKEACKGISDMPAIRLTIRRAIEQYRESIQDWRDEREQLQRDYGRCEGFVE